MASVGRARRAGRLAISSLVLGALLGTDAPAAASPSPAASGSVGAAACSEDRALVYVASADSGPVAAYRATSTGAVAPVVALPNPDPTNTSTFWDPWTLAFDAQGNLYVQTYLSDATTFVFAPNAPSGAAPTRIFRGGGPDARSIALDSQGFAYVNEDEGASDTVVIAPGASGQPSSLYSVTPVRDISTNEGFHPWPSLLTVDGNNELVMGVVGSANALQFFQTGPTGSTTPLRIVSGASTGLGSCASFDSCDHLAVAYSPSTSGLYVGVSAGAATTTTHVSVFAQSAASDTLPSQTIQGPTTGLTGNVITGIASGPCTGDIYVVVKGAQFSSPSQINVYDRLAQGDVAPKRTFTDASNGFADAEGIAIALSSPVAAPANGPAGALGLTAALAGLGLTVASRRRRAAGSA